MSVLVVDDEAHILMALTACLKQAGYDVVTATDGETALQLAATAMPDVVIVDLGLPGIDGREVIRRLRQFSAAPALVLSARDRDVDKVAALDEGADDYLTKPFSVDELLARLRALLRRIEAAGTATASVVRVGAAVVDLAAHAVTVAGVPVRLTATEWSLVEVFVANPGKLLTRNHLINALWGGSHGSEASSLRIYVSHLRRVIESEPANPRFLLTEIGAGYRLVAIEPVSQ